MAKGGNRHVNAPAKHAMVRVIDLSMAQEKQAR
jgi:hypothetical protein